jgi:pilus assembly protein Flp/PilA
MKNLFVRLVKEEEGQDLIEYALLVTLVAVVAAIGATALGTAINGWYGNMATNVSGLAGQAGS